MTLPNDLLRRARLRTSSRWSPGECLSRQELVELVAAHVWEHHGEHAGLDHKYIGKLERGEIRWPGRRYRQALRAILGADTDRQLGFRPPPAARGDRHEQTALETNGSPGLSLVTDDWNRAEAEGLAALLDETAPRITASTMARLAHEWLVAEPPQAVELRAGRRIGENLVRKVERRVVQLRHMDDFVGGGDLYQLVERELACTRRLLQDAAYTDSLGRCLFLVVGELCQLAGRVAADAGRNEPARHYFAVGVKAAHLADSRPLAAHLISTLAYQLSNAGRPSDAVLLAQTASVGAEQVATATTKALLKERVAWAHARAGNRRLTERALVDVEAEYERRRPEDDPEWVYWLDEEEIRVMAARCYVELGQGQRAVPLLTDALASYDERRTRESALYTSWLAEAHLLSGNVDQAAQLASRTAVLAAHTNSTRSDDRVALLRQKLSPHRTVAAVRGFFEQLRELTDSPDTVLTEEGR